MGSFGKGYPFADANISIFAQIDNLYITRIFLNFVVSLG